MCVCLCVCVSECVRVQLCVCARVGTLLDPLPSSTIMHTHPVGWVVEMYFSPLAIP